MSITGEKIMETSTEETVFKIVEKVIDGQTRYSWKYKLNDTYWSESDRSWHTKGECLLNFILEEGYLKIEGLEG